MNKDIITIGAADIFDLAEICGMNVIGYCGLERLDRSRYRDFSWLGADPVAVARVHSGAAFAVSLSSNERRRAIMADLMAAGIEIVSLTAPQASIFPSARLGRGATIQPSAVISSNARLGDGVYINYGALVGHDVEIGDFSFVAPGAQLLGEARLGDGCFLGANAVVFPRVNVGEGARISAGCILRRDVPAGATVHCEQRQRTVGGGA